MQGFLLTLRRSDPALEAPDFPLGVGWLQATGPGLCADTRAALARSGFMDLTPFTLQSIWTASKRIQPRQQASARTIGSRVYLEPDCEQ